MVHISYFIAAGSIGIIFFILTVYAARRESVPGARVLAVIMAALAIYAIGYILQMSSPDLASAVFWFNVSLTGRNLVAPAWFIFALAWTGQAKKLTKPKVLLLALIPALVCLAAWTNPLHQLYGTNFRYVPQDTWALLVWDFGFWYWVGFIYAYGLTFVSIFILLNAARQRLGLFFNQTMLILAGAVVPAIVNLLFNIGITPHTNLDLTPFSLLFTGMIWSLAFFRFRILNIVPIAHELVFKSMPIGMLVLDSLGRVVDINPAAREMIGTSQEILLNRELPGSLPDIFSSAILSSMAEESDETIWIDLENGRRCLDIRRAPFFDRNKKLAGSLLLLNDITSRKQTEDALRESENKLRSLFAAMSDVIIIYDMDGRYLDIGPTIPDLYYKPPQELLGKTVTDLFPSEQAGFFLDSIHTALAVGKLIGVEYSLRIGQKDVWFHANISALSATTVIWVARDVTEQKHIQIIIQESEARLLQAQAIAHLGSWEIDLATKIVLASEESFRIYGLEPGGSLSLEQIQKFPLAEDRKRLDKALDSLLKGTGPYDEEFRILPANEDLPRVLHSIANLERDFQGQPARVFGVIQDITERKLAEKALEESEKRYRSVVQSATDAILTIDPDGKINSWNQGAQNIFQYTQAEILGSSLTCLMPERYREAHLAGVENLAKGRESHLMGQTIQLHGLRKDATEFPMDLVLSSWNEEERTFFTGIIRDITKRQQLEESLKYQSTHDILTGLFNRQYYEIEIERLQQSRRYPISILMMDLDGLKPINDLHGHQAGDELLRQTARVLKVTFRPEDMIARIGGDEFVVILPDLDTATAAQAAQRLKNNLEEHNQAHPAEPAINMSIGIACGDRGTLLSEVFKQADQAMYLDKAERKDHGGR